MLLSLASRPDRLRRVGREISITEWPFPEPRLFEAIDGSLTPAPNAWKSGSGAWGCMQSHQRIFEQALADGVESLLVLEDDVCFVDDFGTKVREFLRIVPDDWDMLMLGGQHVNVLGRPTLVKPGVYRCADCERTHCYAIRGTFIQKLLERWRGGGTFNGEVHCDWIMGRDPEMQQAHKVYAPERFLAGQERGRSDINGAVQPRKFWNPPDPAAPVVWLRAPGEILPELRTHGFHTGFTRDPESGLDRGLTLLFGETSPGSEARRERLGAWIEEIQWEVASDPFLLCTVWQPNATREVVAAASRYPVFEAEGKTAAEVLACLPPELRRPARRPLSEQYVIHLEAPPEVMNELRKHGWHNGYWRDATGLDRGLLRIAEEIHDSVAKLDELRKTIRILQDEAAALGDSVAVIWHPEINSAMVRAATQTTVLEIRANDARDVLDEWNDLKADEFARKADRL